MSALRAVNAVSRFRQAATSRARFPTYKTSKRFRSTVANWAVETVVKAVIPSFANDDEAQVSHAGSSTRSICFPAGKAPFNLAGRLIVRTINAILRMLRLILLKLLNYFVLLLFLYLLLITVFGALPEWLALGPKTGAYL